MTCDPDRMIAGNVPTPHRVLFQQIQHSEQFFVSRGGKVTDSRDVTAWPARLAYLELALELKGLLPPQKLEHRIGRTLEELLSEVFPLPGEEPAGSGALARPRLD